MVRLKGTDSLDDLKGHLRTSFRAVDLSALHLEFFAAAAPDRPGAARILKDFYRVTRRLSLSEHTFNRRARPQQKEPSLMNNLRGPEQLAALRAFTVAKENILRINETIGRDIIQLAESRMERAL